jgi:protein SCO1/2
MRRLTFWARSVLLLSALMALLSACGQPHEFKGTVLDPVEPLKDFTLTDQYNQQFTLSEQKGKIVLLFFGFTSCPDFCPTTLSDLAQVMTELGEDAAKVQVVMVSTDPERDTPERMAKYMSAFNPSFIGLTPSEEQLAKVAKDYGVMIERRELPDSPLGYTVDHSVYTYVIDANGNWRQLYSYGTYPKDIVADLRELIKRGGA